MSGSLIRRPAIWLKRSETAKGRSKLGGLPDLPSGAVWPQQPDTGFSLHFLAQIDLGCLPPTPLTGDSTGTSLPRSGILYFFADMEEEMLWDDRGNDKSTRVLFASSAGAARQPPANLPDIGHASDQMDGGYSDGTGMSVFPEFRVEPFVVDSFARLSQRFLRGEDTELNRAALASIERATGTPAGHVESAATTPFGIRSFGRPGEERREIEIIRHQMLGIKTSVQHEIDSPSDTDWVLLLQLDTDWGVHKRFMFGDMGLAHFIIRRSDLKAANFDGAWGTLTFY